MEINEEDIRKYHAFLGQSETEMRAIEFYSEEGKSKQRVVDVAHVDSADQFLAFCRKWNGKANVYAGINERVHEGTKNDEVIAIRIVAIDIDAVHPKDEAATEEELVKAENIADIINNDFVLDGYMSPMKIMSGNGFQLVWRIPDIEVTKHNRDVLKDKVKNFTFEIISKYSDNVNAKIDQIGDMARILKVPGTMSVKGSNTDARPWRLARIVNHFTNPCSKLRDKILLTDIIEKQPPQPSVIPLQFGIVRGPDMEMFAKLLSRDVKLANLFNGNIADYDYQSRSEAEMALVCMLVYYGFSDELIYKIMAESKIGKWQEKDESYWKLTVEKSKKNTVKRFDYSSLYFAKEGRKTYFSRKLLGDDLMRRYSFKTFKENGLIWVYHNGVYERCGEVVINSVTNEFLGAKSTKHYQMEVVDYIRVSTYVDQAEFNKEKHLINMKNGIYNLETGELLPHTPEFLSTTQLPITYIPNVDCPTIKKFIAQVVGPNDAFTVQEFIGYCLLKDYPIQKGVMLLGSGANGKSTFLSLLKRFLGSANVSSISLQDLDANRFSKANLYGKLANIYADLPDQALHNTGTFKMLTGGDQVTAEKKFQDSFDFVNFAKLIFSANKVPETYDQTDAFFRRWVFITFPYKFEGKSADPKLIDKLSTQEELSGLFNWAAQGLGRLFEQNEFSNATATAVMKDKYEKLSSSVAAFVKDNLEAAADSTIIKADLYQEYVAYCSANKIAAKASNIFAKDLPRYISVEASQETLPGTKIRLNIWRGARFKPKPVGDKEESTLVESQKNDIEPSNTVKRDDLFRLFGKKVPKKDMEAEIPLDVIEKWLTDGDMFETTDYYCRV